MKKYSFLLLLFASFVQINDLKAQPTTADDSEMSQQQLDGAFANAVYSNKVEETEELLQAGANANTEINYLHTEGVGGCDRHTEDEALFYAIYRGYWETTKVLLQNKNKLHNLHKTLIRAMEEAIYYNQPTIAQQLIEAGIDINAQDKYGRTFLIRAINHRVTIVDLLLEAGANVCTPDKDGETALMAAVRMYDITTVQNLLDRPEMLQGRYFGLGTAPVNYADKDGNTALILAVKHIQDSYVSGDTRGYNNCLNSQKIVELLSKVPGINPYHANNKGETAVDLLQERMKYHH